MNDDLKKLESDLLALCPAALDADLLARLESAVDGQSEVLPQELESTQRLLESLEPAVLTAGYSADLEEVVRGAGFPVDEKVVLFPGEGSPRKKNRKRGSWLAAAAAVAFAGALSAFFINPTQPDPNLASRSSSEGVSTIRSTVDRGSFVPASFNSGVSDTHDLGVMWPDRSRPMRVVKVVYLDRVKYLLEEGKEVILEVPRTEFLVVPEKLD